MFDVGDKVICVCNDDPLKKGKIYTISWIEPWESDNCDTGCDECYMCDVEGFLGRSFCSDYFRSLIEVRENKLKKVLNEN